MGCTTSQPIAADANNIFKEVQEHLSLTPLGYHLTNDEVKQLCPDGKIIQCAQGDIIYDRQTAYLPNDKSAVVCMYYFGILCYGLAEVETYDNHFNKTSYTVSTGTILLGEHLFEAGKRHSLNRGYNITAKTQCSIFLVNLKVFEKYAKSLSQSRIDFWNTIGNLEQARTFYTQSTFPSLPPHIIRELTTFVNWRVIDAGQVLTPQPNFDPHALSTALPKAMSNNPGGSGGLSPHQNIQKRPTQVDDSSSHAQTNIPLQYQKQTNEKFENRSLFVVVKGRFKKYPTRLPQDQSVLAHRRAVLGSTNQMGYDEADAEIAVNVEEGQNDPEKESGTSLKDKTDDAFDPTPYDLEATYDYLDYSPGFDDPISFHRRIKGRLEMYTKTNPIASILTTGTLFPNDLVFEMTFFENAEFALQPLVIACERSLVLEIPFHVYKYLSKIEFFQPFVQFIKYRIYNIFATALVYCNIDFFKIANHDTTFFTLMNGVIAKLGQDAATTSSSPNNFGILINMQNEGSNGLAANINNNSNTFGTTSLASLHQQSATSTAQGVNNAQNVTGDQLLQHLLQSNNRHFHQDHIITQGLNSPNASNSNNSNLQNSHQQGFLSLQKYYRDSSTTIILPDVHNLNNISNYSAESPKDYTNTQQFIVQDANATASQDPAQHFNQRMISNTLKGSNIYKLQTMYFQAQYQFFLSLIESSEIHIIKKGDIIQEPNRTVIDKLTVVLYGNLLVSDVSGGLLIPTPQIQTEEKKTSNKDEKRSYNHNYKYNALLQPGDYFNELGLVISFSRPHVVRALSDCIYIQLPRSHFEKALLSRDISLFCIKLGRSQAPLEAILSHNITSDAFYQLALSEHSTENLDFYHRILDFRLKMDGVTRNEVKVIRDITGKKTIAAYTYADLYTDLLDIYNHFIRPDHAIQQVNLPHHVVDTVKENLFNDDLHGVGPDGLIEGLNHKCLDQALAEVILLMRRDILSRFLVHSSYVNILQNIKQYNCHWRDDKPAITTLTNSKDKDSGNNTRWAQRLRKIRVDPPTQDFPAQLTTTIEQQDLVKYEKFLTDLGSGVGNSGVLPHHCIE